MPVVRVMMTLTTPIMEGSDDEFSDLEDRGDHDGDNELFDGVSPAEDPTAPPDDDILNFSLDPASDMDTAAADSEPEWTTSLNPSTPPLL